MHLEPEARVGDFVEEYERDHSAPNQLERDPQNRIGDGMPN